MRDELRRIDPASHTGGESVPVLFLQGFSGDVRPPSGRAKRGPVTHLLRHIRLGPGFEPLDTDEYWQWAGAAARQVAAMSLDCAPLVGEPSLGCARIELPASQFASGAEGLPSVSFQRITAGKIVLVGASAELVSGYAPLVRAMVPDMHIIPVGCIDHVIGYWPTHEMFRDGGYEVVHHCLSLGIAACDPNIEAKVLQQFARILTGTQPLGSPLEELPAAVFRAVSVE